MIGLLRLVGLLNAGIWFGAAVFYTIGVYPVTTSESVRTLLGANNFPYYGGALGQLLTARFFHLSLACSIVALLHLATEWVYLGRVPRRRWPSILVALFLFALAQGWWLQPSLQQWHKTRFLKDAPANPPGSQPRLQYLAIGLPGPEPPGHPCPGLLRVAHGQPAGCTPIRQHGKIQKLKKE